MARNTLLDIAKANGSDPLVGLIEEVIPAVPELGLFEARTVKGTSYKTLVRTALPSVGFRPANKGTPAVKSTYVNREFECMIMNPRWECDQAVAKSYEDGPEAWIAMEGAGVTQAAGITVARQIYYGNATGLPGDASGFSGFLANVDASLVVDALGTTDDTCSSVWGVNFGPQMVKFIFGNNGKLELSDVREETIYDSNNDPLDGYVQTLLARIGLQIASKYAIGRIKKITEDNGKGLTDKLLGKLYNKYPVGQKPQAFLLSRRSLGQLQDSRTATNATGTPAPYPEHWNNIPLVPTDSIVDTEKLAW